LRRLLDTYQVGVHAIPLLGGVDTPAYEDLSEASLAQLSVHVVLRATTNLHLQQQRDMQELSVMALAAHLSPARLA
jgi:hypothetical protein